MTDDENDRVGRTARIPVCYPVMFQTDWYMDEGEVLDLLLPCCAIESSRCLNPDEYVRLQVLPHNAVRVEVDKVRWTERYQFGLQWWIAPQQLCRWTRRGSPKTVRMGP
jgi:hypothetical protein